MAKKQNKSASTKSGVNKSSSKRQTRPMDLTVGQSAAAAAYSSGQSLKAPIINASYDQCRVRHRELIGNVSGTTAYAVGTTVALNPGLPASFPWLSSQAQGWETYRFNKLQFCYYTRTGTNVPGSVIMVPDYDSADLQPYNEQIASSFEGMKEDAPWKDICCELNPAAMYPIGDRKFVRTSNNPTNTDIKTYDVGNFYVATVDGTGVNWGKLWVEYDITFHTPCLPPAGAALGAGATISGSSITTAAPFNGATVNAGSDNLVSLANGSVTFLFSGRYQVSLYMTGTTVTCASPTLSNTSGLSAYVFGPAVAGSGTAAWCCFAGLDAQAGDNITFFPTIVTGGIFFLSVVSLPPNLV